MKVAIVGAGSLGCLYGGILAHSGHDVWLIHRRPEQADALAENGVTIESEHRPDLAAASPIPISATVDAAEVGHADVVIFLVKAHQTEEAAAQHRACVGERTIVLALQNGLRNAATLRNVLDQGRVLSGVTYQGGVTVDTGRVRQTADGRSVFGGRDDDAVEELTRLFDGAGLHPVPVAEPESYVWEKQLVSLAIKPVAALTRLSNDRLVSTENFRRVMSEVVREALAVAEARGIELDDHEDVIAEITTVFAAPEDGEETHRSSMLVDIERGRKTEIDEINGAVVDYAEAENVPVPYNRLLTELVRGLEQNI